MSGWYLYYTSWILCFWYSKNYVPCQKMLLPPLKSFRTRGVSQVVNSCFLDSKLQTVAASLFSQVCEYERSTNQKCTVCKTSAIGSSFFGRALNRYRIPITTFRAPGHSKLPTRGQNRTNKGPICIYGTINSILTTNDTLLPLLELAFRIRLGSLDLPIIQTRK